ncbi:DUF3667 domain-containing protein [Ekhidna sp.]|uniref:DUF3667 domain-containing protein n=1 Tax=Ekhidna sp. TaxID=2608089 RepID=UPI003513F7AC
MKKRRKHKACLNCGELLNQKHNYCPNCGQENTDHHVSIGLLMREFTSNFFSLDSRFAHTFKPFLFNPGKITNAFIEGKRVYYANPIRWYLVISIFHFFFMAKMFEPTVQDKKQRVFQEGDSQTLTDIEFDSLYNLPDTSKQLVFGENWPLSSNQYRLSRHLIETTSLDAKGIMDSLKMSDYSTFRKLAIEKSVKISQETKASLNSYIMRQIPLIIFFILPIYAFLLKLFFWRKGLYIKHLIHSIHIHSFYFFLLGWVWVFSLLIDDFEDFGLPISLIITSVYIAVSFKNVYGVKIIWSSLRLLMIGFIYTIIISFSLLIGVLLSLALF